MKRRNLLKLFCALPFIKKQEEEIEVRIQDELIYVDRSKKVGWYAELHEGRIIIDDKVSNII